MEALQLFLDNFADWDSFVRIWPLLWQGLQLTVLLAVVTLPIAVTVGLLIAVLYSFHKKAPERCAAGLDRPVPLFSGPRPADPDLLRRTFPRPEACHLSPPAYWP